MEENIELNNKVNDNASQDDNQATQPLNRDKSKTEINNEPKEASLNEINGNASKNTDSNIDPVKENNELKKSELKPIKEIPIEKKPFEEFVNIHLIPALIEEFKKRGFEIIQIDLRKTLRPIAEDDCWVIFCEIKETCNFWLSFEKDDITSSKSISLSKNGQKPSVIESFLIDEKRITLNLIVSRILQRLNGQKLIGIN